jgi:integrase
VHVRFSPQKQGGLWYDSWIAEYSFNGKRCRERAKSEREAKTCAEAAATRLAEGDMQSLELRGADRRIYLAAREEIKSFDVSLEVAAREYAEAKRIVKKADLREVARFYTKYAQTKLTSITVPALVKEMTDALTADLRGDYHIRDLLARLGRFAKDYPGQIAEVSNAKIDNWLRGLPSLAKGKRRGEKIKGRTRNNYRNAIVELFNYAKKHGYLPKDLATEAAGTDRVPEDDKRDNDIFTPEQMEDLLSNARPQLIPGMSIKAFTGVRTEEVAFMEWENIDFKRGYIKLPKTITKKKRRRIFPIRPNLRKWIEPFRGLKGRICARWSTPQSVFQAWDRFAKKRKIKAGAKPCQPVRSTVTVRKASFAGYQPVYEKSISSNVSQRPRSFFLLRQRDPQTNRLPNGMRRNRSSSPRIKPCVSPCEPPNCQSQSCRHGQRHHCPHLAERH